MKENKSLAILLNVLIVCSVIMAVPRTFTGAGGTNRWSNPLNWDPPGVPDHTDDVTISPHTSVFGDEEICVNSIYVGEDAELRASIVHAVENVTFETGSKLDDDWSPVPVRFIFFGDNPSLVNRGFIGGAGGIRIEGNENLLVINEGRFCTYRGDLYIRGRVIRNEGRVIFANNCEVVAADTFHNVGTILANNDSTEGVTPKTLINVMNCDGNAVFINDGLIFAGAGDEDGYPGIIFVSADIYEHNGMNAWTLSGGSAFLNCLNANIKGSFVDDYEEDSSFSVHNHRSSTTSLVNINIIADSIEIDLPDSVISADRFVVTARKIIVKNLSNPSSIFCESLVEFKNTNQTGVAADFSGTHTTASITSSGQIRITSNNVIEPPEGLNAICEPDPIISAGGADFNGSAIFGYNAVDSSGGTDSIKVVVVNRGSTPKVYEYRASSALGWVSAVIDSTDTLSPWQHQEFYVHYSIPPSLTEIETDTLTLELFVGGFYEHPSANDFVKITAYPPEYFLSIGDERTSHPDKISISAYPNPFNSSVTITAPAGAKVEIYDLAGRKIDQMTVGESSKPSRSSFSVKKDGYETTFIWHPDESIPSGVYLIRAQFDNGEADVSSTKLVLMK
jgi:hypothetical protein